MVGIIFEGASDEEVLRDILKEYSLPDKEVLFFNFEGKDKIFNISTTLYDDIESDIDAGRIDKILIIVDADSKNDTAPNRGFTKSKEKLIKTIDALEFEIDIDYYIMCGKDKEGNLESFLLSILEDEQIECIRKFRECYKHNLSDKTVYNTFYKHKKEPFDYKHSNFSLLKDKLTNLFE